MIGATGTIGKTVADVFEKRGHVVVRVSRNSNPRVNIDDPATLLALFERINDIDAIVSCAGHAKMNPLAKLTDEDFSRSIQSKLMGQVNLVRIAKDCVKEGGSITITSGALASRPIPGSAAISLVNAALEGFVRAAGLEMPRRVRVNVVSPSWVKETLRGLKMDEADGLAVTDVAKAYIAAVEGNANGEVLEVTQDDVRRYG
ncbi:MAG: short chain dehydrogenase [Anaerolineaceae bacterium]|nr:short chain dehydrogenase [Anaerolineaceae bacterium]